MTYPVTRMVEVLDAAGCSNAAAGAVALIRDQRLVKGLEDALAGMPQPGTPMTSEEREHWVGRLRLFLDAFLPVRDTPPLAIGCRPYGAAP